MNVMTIEEVAKLLKIDKRTLQKQAQKDISLLAFVAELDVSIYLMKKLY